MKRSITLLLFALFLLSLACGGSADNGDEPSGGEIEVKVVNKSPYAVCYVQISDEGSDEWGDDQLGDEETIEAGDSMSFSLEEGVYDVLIRDCDAIPVESAAGISRNTTITVGGAGVVGLLLDNQSPVDICYVFISPSDNDEWGEDWMGEVENIPAGDQRVFYVDPGIYDLLAQDCEGDGNDLVEEIGVDLTDEWTTWTISN